MYFPGEGHSPKIQKWGSVGCQLVIATSLNTAHLCWPLFDLIPPYYTNLYLISSTCMRGKVQTSAVLVTAVRVTIA